MPTPGISLCIPVYNSAPFLHELFACLRNLHPAPDEIVILDDASLDDSYSRIQQFAASVSARLPIRVLRNERNAGIAAAYNRLAGEARNEWVQILDADDLLVEPDYYAAVQAALLSDCDVVITGMDSNSRALRECSRWGAWLVPTRPPSWWPLLGSFATRAGVLYRQRTLAANPFPDPAYPGSDVIHLLHLRRLRKVKFLRRPRVFYRVHSTAQSSQQRDYSTYVAQLGAFGTAIRLWHSLDLRLRQLGQGWLR